MLLKIPSQIGLAGKVQVIRYLLYGHFRGTQQYFYLQYDMSVYNGLRRLTCHLPGDSGEITRRDAKLIRIESHIFLIQIMGLDTSYELMEKLLSPVITVTLKAGKQVPVLVVHI